MRQIEFRGKRPDNGEWVYGNYIEFENHSKHQIFCPIIGCYFVDPATVGQFTGLCDKNGTKIFEGDVVREHCGDYTPIYQNGVYMAYSVETDGTQHEITQFNVIWRNGCEVISNIHDNDLLGEG